jgi:hypothetical protein
MKQTFTILVLATAAAIAGERFDHVVRNDFFAGSPATRSNDASHAEDRSVLAEYPKHAEALVWHGRASSCSRAAMPSCCPRAMKEMDDAVALEPDNIGVRIPRGAVLLSAARNIGDRNPGVSPRC